MKKLFTILLLLSAPIVTACVSQVSETADETACTLDQTVKHQYSSMLLAQEATDAFGEGEGEIIVSGRYSELRPNTLMGEILCFYVDDETAYLIPRYGMDSRIPWFCFSNQDEAKAALAIDESVFSEDCVESLEGEAIVRISNYSVFTKEAAGSDKAKLEEVIAKSGFCTKGCD